MGKVIVDAGAWQLAMNALRRDAEAGMQVRAEIVQEIEKATVSLSDEWQLAPKVPTEEMLLAGMGDDWPEDLYLRDVYELMLEAAPKTPNVKVRGCALAQSQPEGRT